MSRHPKLTSLPVDKKTGLYRLETGDHRDFGYSDGSEGKLLKIILAANDRGSCSMELESSINDWPTKYHLSNLRTNILRALNFLKKDSQVLEVGAGCGGLTRFLGEHFKSVDAIEGSYKRAYITKERCKGLNNVRVYCSPLQEVTFDKEYDVVTLIGVLEYAPIFYSPDDHPSDEACLAMLKHAMTALKDDGCLIIAIENKFGLKYWSGCTEDHTGRLFDSIHGYPKGSSVVTFSRNETKRLLQKAQLNHHEFYYPFPDYKLANTILREVSNQATYYLHNWITMPFEDYSHSRQYYFNETLAIKSLVQAEMIYDLSNSFVVVASKNQSSFEKIVEPQWIAKRFSTNRILPFRTATVLERDEGSNSLVIRKRKLFEVKEPDTFIRLNPSDLKWIPGDLLLYSLCEALYKETRIETLLNVFATFHNELTRRYSLGKRDTEGYPLVTPDAIDYIPCNIILNNEGLFSIDREWLCIRPLSADYILFRAVFLFASDQYPYIFRDSSMPSDMNTFIMSIMTSFYPQYDARRQALNKNLEEDFQSIISGNPVKFPSFDKFGMVKDPILQKEAQINAILNSWSWKITSPLRWFYRKMRRNSREGPSF